MTGSGPKFRLSSELQRLRVWLAWSRASGGVGKHLKRQGAYVVLDLGQRVYERRAERQTRLRRALVQLERDLAHAGGH